MFGTKHFSHFSISNIYSHIHRQLQAIKSIRPYWNDKHHNNKLKIAMRPIYGALFDLRITGNSDGNWNSLKFPICHLIYMFDIEIIWYSNRINTHQLILDRYKKKSNNLLMRFFPFHHAHNKTCCCIFKLCHNFYVILFLYHTVLVYRITFHWHNDYEETIEKKNHFIFGAIEKKKINASRIK